MKFAPVSALTAVILAGAAAPAMAQAPGQMAPLQPTTPAPIMQPVPQPFPAPAGAPAAAAPDGTAFDGALRSPSQQDAVEMPITQLLNQLSSRGYAQYRSINRFGDLYVVEAMTTDMELVTLEVDVRTGEIREAAPRQ